MSYWELGAAFADPDAPVPVHQDQTLLTELPPVTVDAILEVAGPGAGHH